MLGQFLAPEAEEQILKDYPKLVEITLSPTDRVKYRKQILDLGNNMTKKQIIDILTAYENGVDGKEDPGKARNAVEHPQAEKTAGGVDEQLEEKLHGDQHEPHCHQSQHGGNQQCHKFFHNLPPYVRAFPAYTILGQQGSTNAAVTTDGCYIVCQVYRRKAQRCDARAGEQGTAFPCT